MKLSDEELANKHWLYVEEILNSAGENPEIIKKIKFHYISAMIHGIKHGRQLMKHKLSKKLEELKRK
jgi:hypothetical protein